MQTKYSGIIHEEALVEAYIRIGQDSKRLALGSNVGLSQISTWKR